MIKFASREGARPFDLHARNHFKRFGVSTFAEVVQHISYDVELVCLLGEVVAELILFFFKSEDYFLAV